MIDFHTHILPGIDDGAKDIAQSKSMIGLLAYQNINCAVCSPHFYPSQISLQEFLNKRDKALLSLGKCEISLVPGSETMLHSYLFHYPDITRLCIENTRYLLLEMPFTPRWGSEIYAMIEKLITYHEITPIIVHIERYPVTIKSEKAIQKLIHMGCFIQINTSFIINKKTRNKALKYMKDGYVDVLGSDCHNVDLRPPVFEEALSIIQQHLGQSYLEMIERNSNNIINGINMRERRNFIVPPMQN